MARRRGRAKALVAGGIVGAGTAAGFVLLKRFRQAAADPVKVVEKSTGLPLPKFLRRRGRTEEERRLKIFELRKMQEEEARKRREIPLGFFQQLSRFKILRQAQGVINRQLGL